MRRRRRRKTPCGFIGHQALLCESRQEPQAQEKSDSNDPRGRGATSRVEMSSN